jgi:hypothetical protein
MAYTLIGGTAAGTAMILLFLPALYAVWFRIKPPKAEASQQTDIQREPGHGHAMAAE